MEASTSLQRNVDSFKNYLLNIWGNEKPLCKLFSTEKNNYLYDTGTNKIVKCENPEFELLNDLMIMDINDAVDKFSSNHSDPISIKTFSSLEQAMEKENILKITKAAKFSSSAHFDHLEELINTKLKMLQLEATERCNLRCDYCVYNPRVLDERNHGNKDMTIPIAYKSIDYLAEHSVAVENVSVSFYGGEPLLRFPFIKSCGNYARDRMPEKEVRFSFTTNATLMTAEMAKYFFKNNFSITVSLDGPKDIHNDYRKDFNGEGSFKRTVKGLKNLIDVFGKNSNRISLSMVYTPPYSEHKLDRIAGLWDDLTWLPKKIYSSITYPRPGSIPPERISKEDLSDSSLMKWVGKKYMNNYIGKERLHPLAKGLMEKKLALILRRKIHHIPVDEYYLNGCCIQGVRKIFVQTNGDFHLCERMPQSPSIGNAFSGINIAKIKETYIDEYSKKSLPSCSSCWAVGLCPVCYAHAFKNGKLDIDMKNSYCSGGKKTLKNYLKFFCRLLEINPEGLNYLLDMILI